MDELMAALVNVRSRIERHASQGLGEQDTKNAIIAPVLRALGCDLEDLEEVRLEYKVRRSDNPVDYALFLLRTPRLFVEAKALGARLDDRKWASQIMSYATVAGVEWVVLTDGNEYQIYNSHAPVPVDQKLFRRVRVTSPTDRPEDTLSLLSKPMLSDNLIETLWKAHFVDRQVRAAVEALFSSDSDPAFIRLLRRKLPALAPAEIRAAIARTRIVLDLPSAPPPATSGSAVSPLTPGQKAAATRRARLAAVRVGGVRPRTLGDGTPWRHVTMRDLIAAGLVRPPAELHRHYKGHDVRARIEADGAITWEGRRLDSLSTAGGLARQAIRGPRADGKPPQTNGWTFWLLRDTDGSEVEVDALRRRLHGSDAPKPTSATDRRVG
jgi:predicted type IV restriction endonuclease